MSGSFEFLCPHCEQRFRASRSRVGASLTCPRCNATTKVPTPEIGAIQLAERAARRQRDPANTFEEFVVYDTDVACPDTSFTSATNATEPAVVMPGREEPPSPKPTPTNEPAPVLAAPTETETAESRRLTTLVHVPRYVIYTQAALLAVVALVAFVLGALFGGFVDSRRQGEPPVARNVLEGTVSYQSRDGVKPDRDSVVIAVASAVQPSEPIAARQFREQVMDSTQVARARQGLARIGGVMDIVDANGQFALELPQSGDYWLLVLSASQSRPRHLDPPPEQLAVMGHYFSPAFDLVSENQYRWQKVTVPRERSLQIQF